METSFTTTFAVDQTPEDAFEAINDVRGWWEGEIEGRTDVLGEEFSYRVPGIHYSKQRVTELVPGQKVAWLVTDSHLGFVEDAKEWTGTTVTFEVFERDGRTHVRFTHVGLVADHQCYDACSNAWGSYINGSLRARIATGAGQVPVSDRG